MYLGIVDTSQIQSYVFGSNRLRENVGASHLVAQATGRWALKEVNRVAKPNNINSVERCELDDALHIEDGELEAEVMYAGGGNALVLFKDEGTAKTFIRALSVKALKDAPNLQVVMAGEGFDWHKNQVVKTVEAVLDKLAIEKRSRAASTPLLGLGVTVMCQSTGLPAIKMSPPIEDDETSVYPASAEILLKLGEVKAANESLRDLFKDQLASSYTFPLDIDKLGRSFQDQSFVAVVHADGDGMGRRMKKIGETIQEEFKGDTDCSKQNREYVQAMRRFSIAVENSAQTALQNMLSNLVSNIDEDGEIAHDVMSASVAPIKLQKDKSGKYLLPLRPIVFGGDDVTFVCDGRLGLLLALEYIKQFAIETEKRKEDCHGKITSCAGIAIVKSHYPFARAYALAEELCKSAKKHKRKKKLETACLDWHFALSGLMGSLDEIREREYEPKGSHLYLRPVALESKEATDAHTWTVIKKALDAFQGRFDDLTGQEKWGSKRNKLKALRDALREGPGAVEKFRRMFGLKTLPDIGEAFISDFGKTGWRGIDCGYFDAIELADLYMPLKEEVADESGNPSKTQE